MKPRNAREREVVKLYSHLPELSHSQRLWIEKTVVGARILTTGHRCWCTKCGGEWQVDKPESRAICPHCGVECKVEKSRKTRILGFDYVQFLHVHRGWQVIRTTLIRWDCAKGRKQKVYDMDVWQKWCQPGRPVITLGGMIGMNCYWRNIPYSYWGGPLSIKFNHSYFYTDWMDANLYPRMSLLPVYVKALGRNPDFSVYSASTLLGDIFGCPYLESLYKANKHAELDRMLRWVDMLNEFWPSVKVALRHGYRPDDWGSYWEHLRALRYLHYDMRSPRYVAPPDFGELHYRITRQYRNKMDEVQRKREETMRLRRALREEEDRARREREARECAETFAKRISRFAELKIEDTELVIAPLMSIEAFREEGDAMHHCVFNCGYWKKVDKLILSARTRLEGKRVETIEVSLENFTILQQQGFGNAPTDRHDEIRDLVMGAMPQIQRMAMAV